MIMDTGNRIIHGDSVEYSKWLTNVSKDIYKLFEKMDFRWSGKKVYLDDIEMKLAALTEEAIIRLRSDIRQRGESARVVTVNSGRIAVEVRKLDIHGPDMVSLTAYINYLVG